METKNIQEPRTQPNTLPDTRNIKQFNNQDHPIMLLAPFYNFIHPDGGYTGLDFSSGKIIARIRFLPVLNVTEAMIGGKFQGSNESSESGYEDLFMITREPYLGWNEILLENPRTYRYVRYLGAPGTHCIVSKIEYYTREPDPQSPGQMVNIKLKGTPFGASPSASGYDDYARVYDECPDVVLSYKELAQENGYPFMVRSSTENLTFFHQHDFIELVYVKTGSCFHFYRNRLSYLFAGDFIVISPGETHGYFGGINLALVNIMFYPGEIPGKFLDELAWLYGFARFFTDAVWLASGETTFDRFHLPLVHQKEILPLLEMMEKEICNQTHGYRCHGYSLFIDLLVRLSRFLEEYQNLHEEHDSLRKYKLVEEVISYLERNYATFNTIEEVLEVLKISYSRLASIFKKETGLSVYDYLNRIRIGKACLLLVESSMEITDIAYRVGFHNYNNFSRMFKQLIGSSPWEFRNRNRLG